MMSTEGPPPRKRVKISRDELENYSKDELIQMVVEQESVEGGDNTEMKEVSEKLKQHQMEASRRENILVMRLTAKEHEMQDLANQVEALKQAQNPSTAQLRAMLLDPAINLMFQRMKKEMESCKEKLEQAQKDLSAWKFTPDGQTGKRLMAKCRLLLQENEELGKVVSSGRIAKLEGEVALEKKFVEEMKISQTETDDFLVDMDEDIEGMQGTILLLQQQLKDAKDQIAKLETDKTALKEQQTVQKTVQQTVQQTVLLTIKKEPYIDSNIEPADKVRTTGNSNSHRDTSDPASSGHDSNQASSSGHDSNQHSECSETARTNGEHEVPMETDSTSSSRDNTEDRTVHNHTAHNNQSSRAYTPVNHSDSSSHNEGEAPPPSKSDSPSKVDDGIDDRTGNNKMVSPISSETLVNGLVGAAYDSQGDDET